LSHDTALRYPGPRYSNRSSPPTAMQSDGHGRPPSLASIECMTAPRQDDWFGGLGVVAGDVSVLGAVVLVGVVLVVAGGAVTPTGVSGPARAGFEPQAVAVSATAATASRVRRWNERVRMTDLLC
jgi:hypothetical protein